MSSVAEIELSFDYRNQRWKDAWTGLEALAKRTGYAMDRLTPELKGALKAYIMHSLNLLAERHSGPYPGGTGPNSLAKRSGRLGRALRRPPMVMGTRLSNVYGEWKLPFYAGVHETGKVITAKGGYLTIPLPAALNRNGTPKRPSARHWDKTFVQKSKKGNLIIFRNEGGKLVPLYVLKKSVRLPPRMGMRSVLQAGVPEFVDVAMSRMLDRLAAEIAGQSKGGG